MVQRRRRRPSHYHRLNEDEEEPVASAKPGYLPSAPGKKYWLMFVYICTFKYAILRQPRVNWYRGQLTNVGYGVPAVPRKLSVSLQTEKNSHHFLFGEHNKPRRLLCT